MKTTTIAVDLAKDVFQIAVSIHPGKVAETHRLRRDAFLEFFANRPVSTVVMEACGTAHYWARRIQQLGHEVVPAPAAPRPSLRPAHEERPRGRQGHPRGLSKRRHSARPHQDPSAAGARAVSTASAPAGSPSAHARSTRSAASCARSGISSPSAARTFCPAVQEILDEGDVPQQLQTSLRALVDDIATLDSRIETIDREIEEAGRQIPLVRLLYSIPAIGMLTATALFAFIGDFSRFPSGRHLASFLGLTPKEALVRGEAATGSDLQEGRYVPADDADPRRALDPRAYAPAKHLRSPRRVGPRAVQASALQQSDSGARGEGRANRPGRRYPRQALRTCLLDRVEARVHRSFKRSHLALRSMTTRWQDRSDRRTGLPVTRVPLAGDHAFGTRARVFHLGPGTQCPTRRGRRYDCSPFLPSPTRVTLLGARSLGGRDDLSRPSNERDDTTR